MDQTPLAFIVMFSTIAASVAAFFVPHFAEHSVFEPYAVARGRRIHTLITGNLIHADFGHLAFNMLSFYFFAFPLERTVGSTVFIMIYIGSMLIADFPSLIQQRNNENYRTLGASGAVSGCIFSMILFYPTMRLGLFFLPPIIPAYLFGPLYLGYCYYSARRVNDNINHDAHLWGAIGGLLVTVVLLPQSLQIFASEMGWL